MKKWIKDLYPLCRSITGKGTRDTLSYFEKINPELKRMYFNTGDKVFDWKVPMEWNINDAYITHESGKKFAEFKKNNLHVVGYSIPIKKNLSKQELLKNIYTNKKYPKHIPYVTSYYQKKWGFCMSENAKKKLPQGRYSVFIDSNLKKGTLELSHALIKGKSKKEIFFTSYICHPSMANNELSGPTIINAIIKFLKKDFKKLNYSYRFVLAPETIGSIAYLSKKYKTLKKNVIAGYVLSCVGDEGGYSHVESRFGNTLSDIALKASLRGKNNITTYDYLKRGSDERQYCSPGIDLPVCGFSRSKYGEFPEYHSSADNLKFVTQKGLDDSLLIIKNIITSFEEGLYPKYKILCEPHLVERNLYPVVSKKFLNKSIKKSNKINTRMDFLSYADGKKNIFEIADIIKKPLKEINQEFKLLKSIKLMQKVDKL